MCPWRAAPAQTFLGEFPLRALRVVTQNHRHHWWVMLSVCKGDVLGKSGAEESVTEHLCLTTADHEDREVTLNVVSGSRHVVSSLQDFQSGQAASLQGRRTYFCLLVFNSDAKRPHSHLSQEKAEGFSLLRSWAGT